MKAWGHGHSLATGALIGLLVFHAGMLWPLTLMFAFGLLVGRLWARVAAGLAWLVSSRSPLTPRSWKSLRRRVDVLRPDDRIPF